MQGHWKVSYWLLTLIFSLASGRASCQLALLQQQEKTKITKIEFQGNQSFSDRILKKIMVTKESHWYARRYYHPDILKDDLDYLVLFYRDHGFLEIEVKDSLVVNETNKTAQIVITIFEGKRTIVGGLSFLGNQVFSEIQLLAQIKLRPGDPFSKSALEKDNLALLTLYADAGYLEAKVTPQLSYSQQTHRMLITYYIDEQKPVKIGDISIQGNFKTRASVIRRELDFNSGDIFNYSRVLASQRKLYLTGLFKSVFIKPTRTDTSNGYRKDVAIEVAEKQNGELNVGIGYGTVDRLRGSFEVFQNNLWGTARQLGLSCRASFILQRAEISFTDPWLFATRTRTDVTGYAEARQEPAFDLKSFGGRWALGRQLSNFSRITLSYRYEKVTVSNIRGALSSATQKGDTRSLTLSFVWDSRDDLFNARKGAFYSFDFESAGSILRGTNTFIKATLKGKWFFPLKLGLILASAVEADWADNLGTSREVPIQERFYAGGPTSVRGFQEKYLGPLNESKYPIGG
ncbi:MAG: outer membrane protein assembly factor BamA, partial [candidate division KSB1 bacterium]|nr:outer membrane protein assembly factor BamA [candidate division KSB1 bacterium]